LQQLQRKLHKTIAAVSEDVLRLFMRHPWPGNVRQLEHAVEHAIILCQHQVITVDCLPPECTVASIPCAAMTDADSPLREAELLVRALERTGWNKAQAVHLPKTKPKKCDMAHKC